jgi:thiol-disulfide isomerase/thioredoxin
MRPLIACSLGLALGVTPLAVRAAARPADDPLTVELKLDPTGAGGATWYIPQQLRVGSEKPAGLKKEPKYQGKPSYGTFVFGTAGTPVIAVLDRAEGKDPVLYLDANGDGDLTNDPPVRWQSRPLQGRVVYIGQAMLQPHNEGGAKSEPLSLTFYHFVYKPPQAQNQLTDTVLYYRQYARVGNAELGGKRVKVVLLDEQTTGRYDQVQHPDRTPRVQLAIDRDGDGKFDLRYEVYDLARPFNIGGTTYEVASIDPAGARLTLRKSATTVAEVPIPRSLKAGEPAIAFTARDMDGKEVAFPTSYRGKLVMLDFWATWCGPCRGEIPYLVKAYQKYHSQGFEVLGISLDQENQAEAVRKFLAEQKMPWPQVYDGKFWEAAVAKQYSIDSIPHAFLVDGSTGKIVAEGNSLRGEQLDATLRTALAGRK